MHCIDFPCPGAGDKSGDNSKCQAIHAETNAIIQAGDRLKDAAIMYCSTTPCFNCCKLICTTNIKKIFARELYADEQGLELLKLKAVTVRIVDENGQVK
jgi:deoxycytidylate deaminase